MPSVDGNWPSFLRRDYAVWEQALLARTPAGKTAGRCKKDPVLDVVVHKYNPGAKVCKCGRSRVAEPKADARTCIPPPLTSWNPLLYT